MTEHGYTPADLRSMKPEEVFATCDRLLGWTVFAPRVPSSIIPFRETKTVEEMVGWLKDRSAPLTVCYYIGDLSNFRETVADLVVHLQRLQDQSRPSRSRPTGEAYELSELQRKLEVTRIAHKLYESGDIMLAQKPHPEIEATLYLATKRPR